MTQPRMSGATMDAPSRMSPQLEEQVETLIRVTSRLIGVLDAEVELLRAMRVAEIASLQAEKHDLTLLYEETIEAVACQRGAMDAMEPALRLELAEIAQRFDRSLAENARALHAVRGSHDRLLKAIVDAVADHRARDRGYTAEGNFGASKVRSDATALSLSLDRNF
jgi:hypothetical protein